ncbi:MAG: replication initiation protein [Burkholderiales bacterium]|nr:replication initiation protein [Burkholderiales bacterium]
MRRRETDQPPLFPTEDLIIPDTLRSMRKAVSAIHAAPVKAEHNQSLNNRRLFDACILLAQIDCRKRDGLVKRVVEDRVSPVFETRVTDLVRLAGIPGKNYVRIYQELDQLYDMDLQWNIVGEDAKVEWEMKSHFLSSLGKGKGHRRGLVRFSIDPAILAILLEPSNWATLSLQAMKGLGTAAAYALYQNAWRYINTHAKVTAALPTATWIELLMGHSRYVVDDPKQGKRVVNYGDFKRRVLIDALNRVNDTPALSYTLELKELRSGTRVSKLQFKFIPKKQASLGLPMNWPEDVLRVLGNLGFSGSEIEDLSQAHSFEVVAETLLRLKAAEGRLKAAERAITSKKAYFNGILANVASGGTEDDLNVAKMEAEAKVQEAQRAAQVRNERRKEEFAKHQSAVFSGRFFQLAESDRLQMLADFESSAAGKRARILIDKGWNPQNVGALACLRTWLAEQKAGLLEQFFPNPEDRGFDAWLAWRLDRAEALGANE